MKYLGKGRPKAGAEQHCVGYKIQGILIRNEDLYQKKLESKGKFILPVFVMYLLFALLTLQALAAKPPSGFV